MFAHLSRLETPVGAICFAFDDRGLCALNFRESTEKFRAELNAQWPDLTLEHASKPSPWEDSLRAYFGGDAGVLESIPVTMRGTPFQLDVWAALRRIPPGQTISYAQLAVAVGRPKAVRAVGTANGANPVAVVVPCHRVIASSGGLGGYGGGLPRKSWLLEHERGTLRVGQQRLGL